MLLCVRDDSGYEGTHSALSHPYVMPDLPLELAAASTARWEPWSVFNSVRVCRSCFLAVCLWGLLDISGVEFHVTVEIKGDSLILSQLIV